MNLDDTGANGMLVYRPKGDYLYRFDDHVFAPMVDEWEIAVERRTVDMMLSRYFIVKRTDCGAWINALGTRKFVNLKAKKRWACETEAEAAESFFARKRRQLAILRGQIDRVTRAVEKLRETYPLDDVHGLTACATCGHDMRYSL